MYLNELSFVVLYYNANSLQHFHFKLANHAMNIVIWGIWQYLDNDYLNHRIDWPTMTSFIQLTLLTIGKTFVIFGLNLTETSSAHLGIQGQSISLLLEPKHCGAQIKCPEGSQCVKGFCFWERCLLSDKSKGISFRLCPYFNVTTKC